MYFNQIRIYPLLSFEEEQEMAKRIQEGDEEVRQKFVESNLRLVVKIARAYINRDISFMDLIQEGNIGLIHAAGRFDPEKKVRFSTYASWWIKQYILRYLANKRRVIRLPLRKEETLKKIQKTYTELAQRYNREPNSMEIAREIGLTEKHMNKFLSIAGNTVSLDYDSGDPDSASILEFHEDYTYNPERALLKQDLVDTTNKVVNGLKKKEKEIFLSRYQFGDSNRRTLKKISHDMGISPETVRQIEIKVLKKMRNNKELQSYLT